MFGFLFLASLGWGGWRSRSSWRRSSAGASRWPRYSSRPLPRLRQADARLRDVLGVFPILPVPAGVRGEHDDEIPYFVTRITNGWQYLAVFLVVFQFAVPFSLLLSRDLKRTPQRLVMVAFWLIFVRFADLFMLVTPEFDTSGHNLHATPGEHVSVPFVHWLDLAAPVAIGGLFVWMFFTQLRRRPLLPVNDPVSGVGARKLGRPLMAGHAQHNEHAGHWSADDQYLETPPGAGYEHTDALRGRHGEVRLLAGRVGGDRAPRPGRGVHWPRRERRCSLPTPARTRSRPTRRRACRPPRGCSRFLRTRWSRFEGSRIRTCTAMGGSTRTPASSTSRSRTACACSSSAACRPGIRRSVPQAGQAGMMPSDSSSGRVLERRRQ